jgi:hypothetical protein
MRIGRLIVPTGISLAVHALILGLAALATWTITRPPARQLTTAELALDGFDAERGQPQPQPQPEPEQPEARDAGAEALLETLALPDLSLPDLSVPAPVEAARLPVIRRDPGREGDLVGRGLAAIGRDADGGGGSGGGGGATFAGVASGRASSVVFVVDCSGSMVSTLALVVAELERSISRLSPDQRFAIVPFRDGEGNGGNGGGGGGAIETFPRELALVPASDRNLERARAFLRTLTPGGRSDPMAGLEPALALEPQAVFLLARSIPRTEGTWGEGKEAILAKLEALNPVVEMRSGARTRPAQISAVQFLETDPLGIMQAIGAAHGRGRSAYTVLTAPELGRASEIEGPSAREIAADLDEAARLLGALADDQTDLAALVGFPSETQRTRVARDAARALERVDRALGAARMMDEMAGLGDATVSQGGGPGQDGGVDEDPRALLLGARASLLLGASERFGPGMEGAREAHLARAARAGELIGGSERGDGEGASRLEEGPALAVAISTWMLAHGLRAEAPGAEVVARAVAIRERYEGLWRESRELRLASAFVARRETSEIAWADGAIAGEGPDDGTLLLVADAFKRLARVGAVAGGSVGEGPAVYARFLETDGRGDGDGAGLSGDEREAIVRARLVMLRGLGPAREREPLEMLDLCLVELDGLVSAGVHEMVSLVRTRELLEEVEGLLRGVPVLGRRMVVELAAEMVGGDGLEVGGRLAALVLGGAAWDESAARGAEVLMVALSRRAEREPSLEALDGLLEGIARVRRGVEAGGVGVGGVGSGSLGATMRASLLHAAALLASPAIDARWEDAQGYELLREAVEMDVGGSEGEGGGSGEVARGAAAVMRALDAKLAALAARAPDADRQLASMRASARLADRLGVPVSIGVAWQTAEMLVEMGGEGGGEGGAVEACRALVAHPEVGRVPDGGARARVLLARAQRGAGDERGSLETLLGLAEGMSEPRGDGVGSGVGGDGLFWEVWTLTLEGMVRVSSGGAEEGARRAEVARHVTRLGLLDEGLGGEPWRARLRALTGDAGE